MRYGPRFPIACLIALAIAFSFGCRQSSDPGSPVGGDGPIGMVPTPGVFFEPGAEVVVIQPTGFSDDPGARDWMANPEWQQRMAALNEMPPTSTDPTDPTNSVNIGPNPNPNISLNPNPGYNNSIGVGGSVGGGGSGGAGGFVYRRARGGGSAAAPRAVHGRGGPRAIDPAVVHGPRWLEDHQHADGYWRGDAFDADGTVNGRTGDYGNSDGTPDTVADTEATHIRLTGLAVTALLMHGHTHRDGSHKSTVKQGLRYLKQMQDADGLFGTVSTTDHAIATIAMAFDYAATGSVILRDPSQKAADVIVARATTDAAGEIIGWGAQPGGTPDSITTGWVAIALHILRDAQCAVADAAFNGVARHFARVTASGPDGLRTGLIRAGGTGEPISLLESGMLDAMHVIALRMQGVPASDPMLVALADRLLDPARRPDAARIRPLADFVGGLAMFEMGGSYWQEWKPALLTAIDQTMRTDSDTDAGIHGSWDIADGEEGGGRVAATALALMARAVAQEELTRTPEVSAPAQPQQPANAPDGEQDRDGEADGDEPEADTEVADPEPSWIDRILAGPDGTPIWNGRPVTEGQLQAKDSDTGRPIGRFPLQHTRVDASISGMISSVTVTQSYANSFHKTVEAVYVFPLPENSAINEFIMTVGDRVIHGFIRERAEAEAIYEAARAQGHTAALLTQERPNIFVQQVANIAPGHAVDVTMRYVAPLKYEDGEYTFHFPMVVAPRYTPGTPQVVSPGAPADGDPQIVDGPLPGGRDLPTDRVPDADRISPPVLPEAMRSGHDIEVHVEFDAGVPVTGFESVHHTVELQRLGESRMKVRLAPGEQVPNRDFVLRYRVAGEQPRFGLLTHYGDQGGFFTLVAQPPAVDAHEAVAPPSELIFVVDTSGSMQGQPIETVRRLMEHAVKLLRPQDAFNIVAFSNEPRVMASSGSLNATSDNLEAAAAFIDSLLANGGTEVVPALEALNAIPPVKDMRRVVAFITDAQVNNETEVFNVVRRSCEAAPDTRFFAMGIGSSVNRHLVEGVARQGGGQSLYVGAGEGPERVIDKYLQAVRSPLLEDLRLDWGGLQVHELEPSTVGSLWAGMPVVVVGRYKRGGNGQLTIRGRRAGEEVEMTLPVSLPGEAGGNGAIATMWARKRIRKLHDEMRRDAEEELAEAVKDLALRFRLMSRYTAFVAVDSAATPAGAGNPLRVVQPVELPAGTERGGQLLTASEARIDVWGITVRVRSDGTIGIQSVTPGSPADRAGVRAGAELLAVGGTMMTTLQQLDTAVRQATAGSTGEVAVQTREADAVADHRIPR